MGAGRPAAPPTEAVATTVGDPPELLDVHVEQLARSLADVADGDARGSIAVGQAGQAVAAQDVGDSRPGPTDDRRQAVRADAQLVAGGEDRRHLLVGQGRGERHGRELRSSSPATPAPR